MSQSSNRCQIGNRNNKTPGHPTHMEKASEPWKRLPNQQKHQKNKKIQPRKKHNQKHNTGHIKININHDERGKKHKLHERKETKT